MVCRRQPDGVGEPSSRITKCGQVARAPRKEPREVKDFIVNAYSLSPERPDRQPFGYL